MMDAMRLRFLLLGSGLVLLTSCLVAAAFAVVTLERGELEHVSPWRSLRSLSGAPGATRISARLTEVALEAGDDSLFELCSQAPMRGQDWAFGLTAVAWIPAKQKLELKVPLDPAHLALAKHRGSHTCLTLGGGKVSEGGRYAFDLTWAGKQLPESIRDTPLRARVLARRALGLREGLLVLGAAFGAMLSVLAGFAAQGVRQGHRRRFTPIFAVGGTVLAVALAAVVFQLPIPGAVGGLARGLGLALVECGVAFACALYLYRSPREGLGLHAPDHRPGLWLLVAVLCAAVLNPLARLAMNVVPATGEAPIEAFISWPSGALAFAMLGMVVPLAEELFFRGFVFGALRPWGVAAASVGTVLLFAGAHAQQAWGNWGALLSVTLTGIILTALRAATGSALVPAVAHLLYNLSLWKDSFRG
jgi:membrane protease YdiL (CAAX protease family)